MGGVKAKWGENSFKLTWQQSRKPLITLFLGFEILFCHLGDRTDAETNRQTCEKNRFAHELGKKANVSTSLNPANEPTSEIDQSAYPSDGHLPLSGSVAELKHKISAWHTEKKSLNTHTARQRASAINRLPLACIASCLFSCRFLPI